MNIAIVEDDAWYGAYLQHHIEMNPDHKASTFEKAKDFFAAQLDAFDAVTIDFHLPDTDGHQLLLKIKKMKPQLPVVVISGQQDVGTAITMLKDGAFDYLVKEEDLPSRLWVTLKNLNEQRELKQEVKQLRQELTQKYDFSKQVIGRSEPMLKLHAMLAKAAQTNITVSIQGETGTGKEVVAKAIHYNSPSKDKPFVAINVAAIPESLVESELFGHVKGAFTGALNDRKGCFEQASGGTLFLDEVAELKPEVQAKLLRALQEREVTPVGGNKSIKVQVKLIIATHKVLADEVLAGRFREDLYYRMLGVPIMLPALRERGHDILLLARFFIETFCKENDLPIKQLHPSSEEKLLNYSYPGNVRELKSVMELACLFAEGDILKPQDIKFQNLRNPQALLATGNGTEMTMREYERAILNYYLDKYNNNVLKVAEVLDVGKSTIYRMLKE